MSGFFAHPIAIILGIFGLLSLAAALVFIAERRKRRRLALLLSDGEPASATVLRATDTGWRTGGQPDIRIELEVRRPGQSPYRATAMIRIPHPGSPVPYAVGSVVPVRIDRANPRFVAIDAAATARTWSGGAVVMQEGAGLAEALRAAVAAQGGPQRDTAARLQELQRLQREGLISAADYERKRSEILELL